MAKNTVITLAVGLAVFPALNKPDTMFDDVGAYKSDVFLTDEAAAPYIEKIQAIAKSHTGRLLAIGDSTYKKKNKKGDMVYHLNETNSCFNPAFDRETGELTGGYIFKCQVKNRLTKDGKVWDRRPMVIDAKKQVMPTSVAIWGGSTLKVQVEVYEWVFGGDKGINLQPIIVQVLDLKTAGPAGDMGDFDEEDGYVGDEGAPDTSDFDNENSDSSDSDDSDY